MAAADTLAKVELFSELPSADLGRLARFAMVRNFKTGDVIVNEGELGIGFYVIASGRVEVIKGMGSAREKVLTKLGPDDFFGEMALLDSSRRSASVRAIEDVSCLVLTRWDFNAEVNRPSSRIALSLVPILARRIRRLEDAPSH